jgi:hypothetical protein
VNRPIVPEDLSRAAASPLAMLAWRVRFLTVARKSPEQAADWLASQRLPERIQRAVTGAGTMGDLSLGPGLVSIGSWSDQPRQPSAFYRMLGQNIIAYQPPMYERVGIDTTNLTAGIVVEGGGIPVAKVALQNVLLTPAKVARILAYTENVILATGAQGQTTFNHGLLAATAIAADSYFLGRMAANLTPIVSSSPLADLRSAFAAVVPSRVPRMAWVASYDVGYLASTLPTTKSGVAFADASSAGGTLAGLPLYISPGASSGNLYLLDGNQIVANGEVPEVSITQEADLEMSTTPSSSSAVPSPTSMVSLFGTDTVGVRCAIYVAAEKLRNTAVAIVQGIDGTKWAAV